MPPDPIEITPQVLAERIKGLQQLTETKFQLVEKQLTQLTSALEKLALTAVTEAVIEKLNGRIAALEQKQQKTATAMQLLRLVAVIGQAILIAILIALATGKARITWQ